MSLRSPIVSVLGHVDHGKSSILDAIRGTNIVAGEAGAITQAIGASIIPLDTIKRRISHLSPSVGADLKIPGLLFIDTPGHAAFTSLRRRGGSLADLAILVVDINEGFKPQTYEALEILKNNRTPFVIAANKLDLVPGFQVKKGVPLVKLLNDQSPNVLQEVENRLYTIVGEVFDKFGLQSERFDRVEDFTKQVAIVPCSAKQQVGLEELLLMLTGLAQKYLEQQLSFTAEGPGKGVILEVKEDKGLGRTIDVILYDGTIKVGDLIVYGTLDEPKSTKVRALFEPQPNTEIRDRKGKFRSVKEAVAATGVKVSAPDLEGAAAGMPVVVVPSPDAVDSVKERIKSEIERIEIDTDDNGIIIKADTLGSLEAMINLLNERDIPIRKASVGQITKKDISEAEANFDSDPLTAVILGFNINSPDDSLLAGSKVKVIVDNIIYKLIERFEEWQDEVRRAEEAKQLEGLVRPCKVEVLQNCIFRQSNPCIVGVEVIKGVLRSGTPLMREDGRSLTVVKSIEAEGKSLSEAERGRQVAISLPGVIAGRQLFELDFLYADIPEEDFRKLKKLVKHLSSDEVEALKEIARIKREHNPVWGV